MATATNPVRKTTRAKSLQKGSQSALMSSEGKSPDLEANALKQASLCDFEADTSVNLSLDDEGGESVSKNQSTQAQKPKLTSKDKPANKDQPTDKQTITKAKPKAKPKTQAKSSPKPKTKPKTKPKASAEEPVVFAAPLFSAFGEDEPAYQAVAAASSTEVIDLADFYKNQYIYDQVVAAHGELTLANASGLAELMERFNGYLGQANAKLAAVGDKQAQLAFQEQEYLEQGQRWQLINHKYATLTKTILCQEHLLQRRQGLITRFLLEQGFNQEVVKRVCARDQRAQLAQLANTSLALLWLQQHRQALARLTPGQIRELFVLLEDLSTPVAAKLNRIEGRRKLKLAQYRLEAGENTRAVALGRLVPQPGMLVTYDPMRIQRISASQNNEADAKQPVVAAKDFSTLLAATLAKVGKPETQKQEQETATTVLHPDSKTHSPQSAQATPSPESPPSAQAEVKAHLQAKLTQLEAQFATLQANQPPLTSDYACFAPVEPVYVVGPGLLPGATFANVHTLVPVFADSALTDGKGGFSEVDALTAAKQEQVDFERYAQIRQAQQRAHKAWWAESKALAAEIDQLRADIVKDQSSNHFRAPQSQAKQEHDQNQSVKPNLSARFNHYRAHYPGFKRNEHLAHQASPEVLELINNSLPQQPIRFPELVRFDRNPLAALQAEQEKHQLAKQIARQKWLSRTQAVALGQPASEQVLAQAQALVSGLSSYSTLSYHQQLVQTQQLTPNNHHPNPQTPQHSLPLSPEPKTNQSTWQDLNFAQASSLPQANFPAHAVASDNWQEISPAEQAWLEEHRRNATLVRNGIRYKITAENLYQPIGFDLYGPEPAVANGDGTYRLPDGSVISGAIFEPAPSSFSAFKAATEIDDAFAPPQLELEQAAGDCLQPLRKLFYADAVFSDQLAFQAQEQEVPSFSLEQLALLHQSQQNPENFSQALNQAIAANNQRWAGNWSKIWHAWWHNHRHLWQEFLPAETHDLGYRYLDLGQGSWARPASGWEAGYSWQDHPWPWLLLPLQASTTKLNFFKTDNKTDNQPTSAKSQGNTATTPANSATRALATQSSDSTANNSTANNQELLGNQTAKTPWGIYNTSGPIGSLEGGMSQLQLSPNQQEQVELETAISSLNSYLVNSSLRTLSSKTADASTLNAPARKTGSSPKATPVETAEAAAASTASTASANSANSANSEVSFISSPSAALCLPGYVQIMPLGHRLDSSDLRGNLYKLVAGKTVLVPGLGCATKVVHLTNQDKLKLYSAEEIFAVFSCQQLATLEKFDPTVYDIGMIDFSQTLQDNLKALDFNRMVPQVDRTIFHIDMNNCFASIEMKLFPRLRGKAVVVAGDPAKRKGIISAKSDKAKKAGIKTAMAVTEAVRTVPNLICVPSHYEEYHKHSLWAQRIYREYTDHVEPFGLDECWLDVTDVLPHYESALALANMIRERIKDEMGITVSIGVSWTKVFAKLGSDLKKPDAVTVITPENFKDKLYHLPVSEMIGIGRQMKKHYNALGIYTLGQLAEKSYDWVVQVTNNGALSDWMNVRGLSYETVRHVNAKRKEKSLSHGETVRHDLTSKQAVRDFIYELAMHLALRLHRKGYYGRRVSIGLCSTSFERVGFQANLPWHTNSAFDIAEKAFELYLERYNKQNPIRQITIGVGDLIDTYLTPEQVAHKEKLESLTRSQTNAKVSAAISAVGANTPAAQAAKGELATKRALRAGGLRAHGRLSSALVSRQDHISKLEFNGKLTAHRRELGQNFAELEADSSQDQAYIKWKRRIDLQNAICSLMRRFQRGTIVLGSTLGLHQGDFEHQIQKAKKQTKFVQARAHNLEPKSPADNVGNHAPAASREGRNASDFKRLLQKLHPEQFTSEFTANDNQGYGIADLDGEFFVPQIDLAKASVSGSRAWLAHAGDDDFVANIAIAPQTSEPTIVKDSQARNGETGYANPEEVTQLDAQNRQVKRWGGDEYYEGGNFWSDADVTFIDKTGITNSNPPSSANSRATVPTELKDYSYAASPSQLPTAANLPAATKAHVNIALVNTGGAGYHSVRGYSFRDREQSLASAATAGRTPAGVKDYAAAAYAAYPTWQAAIAQNLDKIGTGYTNASHEQALAAGASLIRLTKDVRGRREQNLNGQRILNLEYLWRERAQVVFELLLRQQELLDKGIDPYFVDAHPHSLEARVYPTADRAFIPLLYDRTNDISRQVPAGWTYSQKRFFTWKRLAERQAKQDTNYWDYDRDGNQIARQRTRADSAEVVLQTQKLYPQAFPSSSQQVTAMHSQAPALTPVPAAGNQSGPQPTAQLVTLDPQGNPTSDAAFWRANVDFWHYCYYVIHGMLLPDYSKQQAQAYYYDSYGNPWGTSYHQGQLVYGSGYLDPGGNSVPVAWMQAWELYCSGGYLQLQQLQAQIQQDSSLQTTSLQQTTKPQALQVDPSLPISSQSFRSPEEALACMLAQTAQAESQLNQEQLIADLVAGASSQNGFRGLGPEWFNRPKADLLRALSFPEAPKLPALFPDATSTQRRKSFAQSLNVWLDYSYEEKGLDSSTNRDRRRVRALTRLQRRYAERLRQEYQRQLEQNQQAQQLVLGKSKQLNDSLGNRLTHPKGLNNSCANSNYLSQSSDRDASLVGTVSSFELLTTKSREGKYGDDVSPSTPLTSKSPSLGEPLFSSYKLSFASDLEEIDVAWIKRPEVEGVSSYRVNFGSATSETPDYEAIRLQALRAYLSQQALQVAAQLKQAQLAHLNTGANYAGDAAGLIAAKDNKAYPTLTHRSQIPSLTQTLSRNLSRSLAKIRRPKMSASRGMLSLGGKPGLGFVKDVDFVGAGFAKMADSYHGVANLLDVQGYQKRQALFAQRQRLIQAGLLQGKMGFDDGGMGIFLLSEAQLAYELAKVSKISSKLPPTQTEQDGSSFALNPNFDFSQPPAEFVEDTWYEDTWYQEIGSESEEIGSESEEIGCESEGRLLRKEAWFERHDPALAQDHAQGADLVPEWFQSFLTPLDGATAGTWLLPNASAQWSLTGAQVTPQPNITQAVQAALAPKQQADLANAKHPAEPAAGKQALSSSRSYQLDELMRTNASPDTLTQAILESNIGANAEASARALILALISQERKQTISQLERKKSRREHGVKALPSANLLGQVQKLLSASNQPSQPQATTQTSQSSQSSKASKASKGTAARDTSFQHAGTSMGNLKHAHTSILQPQAKQNQFVTGAVTRDQLNHLQKLAVGGGASFGGRVAQTLDKVQQYQLEQDEPGLREQMLYQYLQILEDNPRVHHPKLKMLDGSGYIIAPWLVDEANQAIVGSIYVPFYRDYYEPPRYTSFEEVFGTSKLGDSVFFKNLEEDE